MLVSAKLWRAAALIIVLLSDIAVARTAADGDAAWNSIEAVLAAVVGVEATVPEASRTAEFLGTRRQGSGVLIDDQGLVLTVGYLILEASSAELLLADGSRVPANLVGYDHDTGFGLLRAARPLSAAPLRLGSAAVLRERDTALAVSHNGDIQPVLVVSRRDFAGYWEYLLEDALFTAPPYRRFAGAALLNPAGELVGIGSLAVGDAYRDGEFSVPGNLFIPIERLAPVLEPLLARGRGAAKPWLGLYAERRGAYLFITRLAEGGPASRAGLRVGELIVGVAGRPAADLAELYRQVWALGGVGVAVPLTVLRDGRLIDIDIQSGDRYDWLQLEPSV